MDFLEPEERDYLFDEAIRTGNSVKVGEMIAFGADIHQGAATGDITALDVAVEEGHSEVVRVLLEAGACPNTGLYGDNALASAASRGYTEIARMLILAGAKVSTVSCTILQVAAVAGHLEIVRLLVETGANVNLYGDEEALPIMWAAKEGHQAVFEYLAPLTDPEQRKEAELAALHLAASEGKIEALQLLFNVGADLNSKDGFGETALMIAAQQRQPRFVQPLLQMGADINAKDNEGRTALMVAAQSSYITTVKILIRAGADVNAKDIEGNTALTYAEKAKDKIIAKLLRGGWDYEKLS